jgi:hypothetical protein
MPAVSLPDEPRFIPPVHPAAWDEASLLEQCEVKRQRRSGPGGQHRNKVETAVVITHLPTGLRGAASERRSQEQNRHHAILRLRVNMALGLRQDASHEPTRPSLVWQKWCSTGRVPLSATHPDFPALLAEALDQLQACQFELRRAADRLQCSPSQLVKLLQREPRAIEQLNRYRQQVGLKPLK